MDTATAASMSWPDHNPAFRRRWAEPPPMRSGPALGQESEASSFEKGNRGSSKVYPGGVSVKVRLD